MRFFCCMSVCCLTLTLSQVAAAIPIAGCAALPSIVRLTTIEDPQGVSQVSAINDSCVAVGAASTTGSEMPDTVAIWTGTDLFTDPKSVQVDNPELAIPPYADDGLTRALDINNLDEVLVWYELAVPMYSALPHYAIFYMDTDTWSAPISLASWTHSPELTNRSGWKVKYGPNWEGYENAYLVASTPEPSSWFLCFSGLAALLLIGSRKHFSHTHGMRNSARC